MHERHLENISSLFERYPQFDVIGGNYSSRLESRKFDRGYNCMIELWLKSKFTVVNDRVEWPVVETRQLVGGNACYRRSVFSSGHRFQPLIRWGGEETELHSRLHDAGMKLGFAPDLSVEHASDNDLNKTFRRAFAHGVAAARLPMTPRNDRWQALRSVWRALVCWRWSDFSAFTLFMFFHWPVFWLGRAFQTLTSFGLKGLKESQDAGLRTKSLGIHAQPAQRGLALILLGEMEASHNSSANRAHT